MEKITREKAAQMIKDDLETHRDYLGKNYRKALQLAIDELQKPERKTGKWIVRETACEDVEARCSCCGFSTLVNEPGNGLHMIDDLNFCSNCGAEMVNS